MITMREAKRLYQTGNDRGHGFNVSGVDSIADASIIAVRDGWKLILGRNTSDDIAVFEYPDGSLLGIGGDAQGKGAWSVMLSDEIDALAAHDTAESEMPK